MANELTWNTSANNATTQTSANVQSQWEIWFLAECLAGNTGWGGSPPTGVWSVVSSSNGTTYGTGDNWGGGTFSSANIVVAAGGTDHSWMVLKSPTAAGSINATYLIIDAISYTSPQISYCTATPGTGSLTNAPTATDQIFLQVSDAQNNGSVAVQHYKSLMLSTRGDFWCLEHYTGAGSFYSCVFLTQLQDNATSDSYIVVSGLAGGGVVSTGTAAFSSAYSTSSWGSLYGSYNKYFTVGTSAGGTAGTTRGAIASVLWPYTVSTSASVTGFMQQSAQGCMGGIADSVNSYWDNLPIYVVSTLTTNTTSTIKGRMADCTYSSGPTTGSTSPATGFQVMNLGAVWVPWTAGVGPAL